MTKKDYILIAKVIEAHVIASTGDTRKVLGFLASHLARELKEDNRAFDKSRFLEACGFVEEGK